jgi:hypothetical protein
MPRLDALFCKIATATASGESAAIDRRLARSAAEDLKTILTSREAIATSRNLLAWFELRAHKLLAARPPTAFCDIPEATLNFVTGNVSVRAGEPPGRLSLKSLMR